MRDMFTYKDMQRVTRKMADDRPYPLRYYATPFEYQHALLQGWGRRARRQSHDDGQAPVHRAAHSDDQSGEYTPCKCQRTMTFTNAFER